MWTIFHTEASLGWGGQEIRILNESLGMRARGHRVVIIAQDDSTILAKAGQCGLESISLSFRKKDYIKTFFGLLRAMKVSRPDFVNTHSSRDSWLASTAGRVSRHRPVILRTRHISTPVATNMPASLIYRYLPDRIITTAEAIREQLIARNNVPPGKISSIPTGIDTDIFDPRRGLGDIRTGLGLPKETPLVGMVSVLRSWKGHDYFIDAAGMVAGRFPEARFLIVGDGPRREALEEMIQAKGLTETVLMLGHRDDVPEILKSLDVFVQPSYANEGVPQSIVQAMAMEVPVVASDLLPFRELIRDGENGLMVPVRDPRALAGKIMLLLEDKGLGRALGHRARALVLKRFSIERMLDSTEELYKSLVEGQ